MLRRSTKNAFLSSWRYYFQGFQNYAFFFQQIMRYFLANYAPKILNYAKIMQIAQYF